MEINAYSRTYGSSSTTDLVSVKDSKGTSLGMGDFLNLLVAQMTNQDVMNPMENTEFISQLAQFSSLQAMTDLTETSRQLQAASLIGKNVVVADYNSKGQLVVTEGKVEKVTIFSGETNIFVDGTAYKLSNLMEIKADKKDKTSVADSLN